VRAAGRALQFTGIVVTGVALFVGIGGGDARRELLVLALGAAVFFAGRLVERGRA
jgi:hypothetical protein